jgi:hypothetical protein
VFLFGFAAFFQDVFYYSIIFSTFASIIFYPDETHFIVVDKLFYCAVDGGADRFGERQIAGVCQQYSGV